MIHPQTTPKSRYALNAPRSYRVHWKTQFFLIHLRIPRIAGRHLEGLEQDVVHAADGFNHGSCDGAGHAPLTTALAAIPKIAASRFRTHAGFVPWQVVAAPVAPLRFAPIPDGDDALRLVLRVGNGYQLVSTGVSACRLYRLHSKRAESSLQLLESALVWMTVAYIAYIHYPNIWCADRKSRVGTCNP